MKELFGQVRVTEEVMAAVPANDFRIGPAVIQSAMERCNEWELVPLREGSTVQLWTASLPHRSDTLQVAWLLHLARRGRCRTGPLPILSAAPLVWMAAGQGDRRGAQVPARGAMTARSATLPPWRRPLAGG